MSKAPGPIRDDEWTLLLSLIKKRQCLPFIGDRAAVPCINGANPWLPLASDIAEKWARDKDYPLEDSSTHQLPRIAQFLAIEDENEYSPKNKLSTLLQGINPPDFALEQYRNAPYAVLAELNLPIYITTNYDLFLEAALRSKGKDPVSEFCRWNNYAEVAGIPSVFDKPSKYKPTEAEPLVYHLHGDINNPPSMVLTEKDYIDFVINLNKEKGESILPVVIRQALATSSLLFIGYSLEDMNFRVIFQGVINLQEPLKTFQPISIAVQLAPIPSIAEKKDKVQRYLDNYTKNMFKVRVYWGDVCNFATEMRDRWDAFRISTQQLRSFDKTKI